MTSTESSRLANGKTTVGGHTTVIIVNYNGLADTLECLESVNTHCRDDATSIVLIDNSSSESIERFVTAGQRLQLTIIQSHLNVGFTGACNLGMQVALENGSDYVFLLNNDAVLVDDVVAALKAKLETNKTLGIIGAVNYHYSSPEYLWCAGIKTNPTTGRHRSVRTLNRQNDDVVLVDYVPGSSLMISTDLLREIGLFDNNYFAYMEDKDLCRRAQKKHYNVGFLSNSKVLHKVGKSSPTALKEYLRTRNSLYFLRTHSTPGAFLLGSALVIIHATILSASALFLRRRRQAASYVAGMVDFLRNRMGAPPAALFQD